MRNVDVVIVGGGAAGTLAAVQLARQARGRLRIALVERTGRAGRGVAYGTPAASHLLNVPAGRMSAFPDRPGDFTEWLTARGIPDAAGSFVPRSLYGEYLESVLLETRREAGGRVALSLIASEAIAVRETAEGGHSIATRDGRRIVARTLVLAMGNLPPAPSVTPGFSGACFHPDPWDGEAHRGLDPDAEVLLLGTGLTMVDVALELKARGHRGAIHALSRRGLLPAAHSGDLPAIPPSPREGAGGGCLPCDTSTLRSKIRELRARVRDAGANWRDAIDALRPHTPRLWAGFSPTERARFLRHARRYWDVHRHRMPPGSAAELDAMRAARALQIHAGRPLHARAHRRGLDVTWTAFPAGDTRSAVYARVINCTGTSTDLVHSTSPFAVSLREGRMIQPDLHGLGLATQDDGRVLRANGKPHASIFAIGPLRRAGLWESTAVPEIRTQAAALAGEILTRPLARKPRLSRPAASA